MEIAFVGLGRMGGGMTHRLLDDGHTVFGYAPSDKDRSTNSAARRVTAQYSNSNPTQLEL